MSLEVTELQGGGIRGRQILYFCNLKAQQNQIFRKCYFLYLFHITDKYFFEKLLRGCHVNMSRQGGRGD